MILREKKGSNISSPKNCAKTMGFFWNIFFPTLQLPSPPTQPPGRISGNKLQLSGGWCHLEPKIMILNTPRVDRAEMVIRRLSIFSFNVDGEKLENIYQIIRRLGKHMKVTMLVQQDITDHPILVDFA